jgi:hypothetical protein
MVKTGTASRLEGTVQQVGEEALLALCESPELMRPASWRSQRGRLRVPRPRYVACRDQRGEVLELVDGHGALVVVAVTR